MGPDSAPDDAQAFIATLDEVDLSRFRVVGTYTRYDEAVRNALQDARQKILAGFEPPGRKRENHLIWAAPGTGKTYFVQQVAVSIQDRVRYHEINLAKCTEPDFRGALGRLDDGQACLCLIDEVDAKPHEPWPYEVLLPYLDASVERAARFVFVLAGSSGASLDDIKHRIAARPKGTDLLSRVPTGHEHVIGPMNLGDRLLIVLSQLRQAGLERGRDIRAIEKLGLYYVALNERLANARQLREFAVRAVERVPRTDDRVKYDHLFVPGDPENKAFWVQAQSAGERFVNTFVILAGDHVVAAPSVTVSAQSHNGAPEAIPASAAEARSRTNLPRELTSFVGRAHEIEEVKRLLPTTPLLTLHGPGGCGKTRLALKAAAEVLDEYADGVWWVDLGPLADLQLVPQTVGSALSVTERPGRRLVDTLVGHLQARTLLLVLDNCEHLLSACAELADALLRHCPGLRMLVTSREGLGIAGETLCVVPSLTVPDRRALSLEQFGQYEAVQLFAERARAITPSFAVTARNADAIAQVCRRLDGIPLAIELAAARVKVLPVEQIASRLDQQFHLLTGGSRVALPRHQTLRAAMDWSHDLLSPQERTMLHRLSVFAGGWTLEAAEQVCVGDDVASQEVLDLLTHLVDKSLVVAEEREGRGRYRMLETVRQYGRDRLLETGGIERVRARHRDYFFALLEEAGPHIGSRGGGLEQAAWLDRLDAEYDNLRAAMEWSLGTGGMDTNLEPLKILEDFRETRGYWSEGLRSLEPMLLTTTGIRSPLRAWALRAAGASARRLGDISRAVTLLEEAIVLNRALEDKTGLAESLMRLGVVVYRQGDYRRAAGLFEETVSLLELNDTRDVTKREFAIRRGFMLYLLGVVARLQGDYGKAKAWCEESLALNRALERTDQVGAALDGLGLVALCLGDYERANTLCGEALALVKRGGHAYNVLSTLNSLGLIACAKGDYSRAVAMCDEALALARELGERGGVARALNVLGRVAFYRKDSERATTLHREALSIFRDLGEKLGIAQCLERLGIIGTESVPDQAARFLAAAESIRDAIGAPLPPFERPEIAKSVNHVRAMLMPPAATEAWAEGRAMTLERAIQYALATEDQDTQPSPHGGM